jgi:acetyl esterase/lipase
MYVTDRPHLVQIWPEEEWAEGTWPGQSRLEVYPPPARPEKRVPAVLIIPGGGYGINAPEEGAPVAQLFARHGFYAMLLFYRVAPHRFPAPMADACRAVRLARSFVNRLMIDPDRICVLGFSAGGHLASLVATRPEMYRDLHDDLADSLDARPNRLGLVYPVISLEERTHEPTVQNLLGPAPSREVRRSLSTHLHVNERTPPAFIVHAADDEVVPVQHSLLFAAACADYGVPFHAHIYEKGGHGFSVVRLTDWINDLIEWLCTWERT